MTYYEQLRWRIVGTAARERLRLVGLEGEIVCPREGRAGLEVLYRGRYRRIEIRLPQWPPDGGWLYSPRSGGAIECAEGRYVDPDEDTGRRAARELVHRLTKSLLDDVEALTGMRHAPLPQPRPYEGVCPDCLCIHDPGQNPQCSR